MMEKPLPQSLEAVKAEVNRFLADLLQRATLQLPPAKIPASAQTAAKEKKISTISEFCAALPDEIRAELERKTRSVMATVSRELDLVYQQVLVKPQKTQKKSGGLEGLSLIDDEELMFRLVLDNFSSKVNEQYKVAIALTCLRFEKVLGFEIDLLLSPMAPFTLGAVLKTAMVELNLDVDSKKQLLMAVLKGLIVEYAQLLKTVNELFVKKGILPRINDADAKARIEKYLRKVKALEEGREYEEESGNAAGPEFAQDFFRKIAIAEDSQHIVASNPAGPVIPQERLLNNISSMKSVLVSTDDQSGYMQPVETQSTFAELLASNTDIPEYALTPENSKTIGIISMLFDTLKKEDDISPPIKALLLQLTVPLLKAAVQDEEFFSDKSNPAQILFNSIAEASSSWAAEGSAQNDFLYQKMSGIVQKVTDEYDHDYSVFEDAVDDFESFVDTEQQKSQRVEERIIANETAQARIQAARKLAQQRIYDKFGDYILDEALKHFFDKTWEQALFYIANNSIDNQDTAEWGKITHIEEQLLKILDNEQPSCSLDELFADIRELLMLTGRPEADIKAELHTLQAELSVLLQGGDNAHAVAHKGAENAGFARQASAQPVNESDFLVNAELDTSLFMDMDIDLGNTLDLDAVDIDSILQADSPVTGSVVDDYEQDIQKSAEAQMRELLANIGIGCWMEDREKQPFAKLKLAAHIKYTDTYVFVNRKGVKVASLDGPTLAMRIRERLLVMVDNSQLYDRSMETIIGNLRN